MKRIFLPLAWLCMTAVMLSSCLGDNEDETTYYSDTAISAFVLGTMNCYLHTTSSIGADSIYKVTYTGSAYKFYIDHINRSVYNTDSLPYGTDAKHVVCTITAKNLGYVGIKSLVSDTIFTYISSDSIDFTSPRTIRVVSYDTQYFRDYTVKVNVHQEQANEFRWQQMSTPEWLGGLQTLRALPTSDRMYVFGSADGTSGVIYSSPIDDGNTWSSVGTDINTPLTADICENVAVKDDKLYMAVGGQLLRSDNGTNWEQVASMPYRLLGASSTQLFAQDTDGMLYASSDEGATWSVETLDDLSAMLPTTHVSVVASTLVTDDMSERVTLLGNRDVTTYPGDETAAVWAKIWQPDDTSAPWMLLTAASKSYELPRMSHVAVIPYAEGLLALGAEGVGACSQDAFKQFYLSLDGGLTWATDSRFSLPSGFSSGSAFTMTVDGSHFIWLFCTESGQVWRGRLNKEGWTTEQKAITE